MKNFLKSRLFLITAAILVIGIVFFSVSRARSQSQTPECNQVAVEKGDLSRVYSLTGKVSNSNTTDVTSTATGVVKEVYAKDGDVVKVGDKIALIELDQDSLKSQSSNYAAYMSAVSTYESAINGQTGLNVDAETAKNALTSAEDSRASLQKAVDSAQQSLIDAQEDYRVIKDAIYKGLTDPITLKKYTPNELKSAEMAVKVAEESLAIAKTNLARVDTTIDLARKSLSLSQDKAASSQTSVASANASLRAARLAYDLSGPVVKAPISGVVKGVRVLPGTIIKSTAINQTGYKLANIETAGKPLITASATESEAAYIKIGHKAEISFEVITNKKYEGRIISINASSVESSGSASYEVTIELTETPSENILPNMSADIDIIPETKNSVLLVPSSAVENTGSKTLVKKIVGGKITELKIEIGDESEILTEIKSGLMEGDLILKNFSDKKITNGCESR